jgi:hypothetical protein
MGLLFMIAGYFVAGSCDRKGFGRFVGERFKRLDIPSLIYMVVRRGDNSREGGKMTQYGTWKPYTGSDALLLAVVLLIIAGVLAYLGTRLNRSVQVVVKQR